LSSKPKLTASLEGTLTYIMARKRKNSDTAVTRVMDTEWE
jgi:hypothetical protein